MALTMTFRGFEQLKGPFQGSPLANPAHLCRFVVNVAGTYLTNGNQIDLCNYFVNNRQGVTAINVRALMAYGDYFDGTNTLTVNNAAAALASGGAVTPISAASTNNLVTVKLFTGINGIGGSEVANATPLSGDYGIVALVELTFGTAGVG